MTPRKRGDFAADVSLIIDVAFKAISGDAASLSVGSAALAALFVEHSNGRISAAMMISERGLFPPTGHG